MSRDEALNFLTKVTDELGRSIEVVGTGPTSTPTTPGRPRTGDRTVEHGLAAGH